MQKINVIMMVDDDIMTAFINKRILKIIGYTGRTVVFHNAHDALLYLQNASSKKEDLPDLIFTDINMPKMNGWQFLDEFSKMHTINKQISVMMLTNSVNQEDTIRSSQYGMVDHILNKPLTEFELKKLLKMHASDEKLIAS
ncbi:response regulator [Maribacter sp. 4G9]|uniref:response regulator n=1 Tax=Maribacter sp. 4G9 TaxID=1889777 RepID=UPI000C15ABBD|nr:response regulator [Maribacter sp. 4G9]PIB25274.1 hypothetical protein BFP75_09585 [Maribacter sp. 4G9]